MTSETPANPGRLANLVAVVLAVVTSVVLYFAPMGTRETTTITEDKPPVTTVEQVRLDQLTGYGTAGLLVLLVTPVVVTGLPLALKNRNLLLGCAVLLTLLCLLAGFSIGLFYVPAAIALWVAAKRSARTSTG